MNSHPSDASLQKCIDLILFALLIAIILLVLSSSAQAQNNGDTLQWNSTTLSSWISGTGSGPWFDITTNAQVKISGVTAQNKNYAFLFSGTVTNGTQAPNAMTMSGVTLYSTSITFQNSFSSGTANTTTISNGSATASNLVLGSVNGSSLTTTTSWSLTDSASSGIVTFADGASTLTLKLFSSGTISVANGATVAISSAITDFDATHTGGITKNGTGTLTLSGANTYTGGTTLTAGTLRLSGSGTLGSTAGALTVNGGTLDLGGASPSVGAFTGSGGQVTNSSSTASTLTVGNGGGNGTYAGTITNTGTINLTKTGTGTLTLTNLNSYSGATLVSGGTLELKNASSVALSGTSGVKINNGGTLLFSANNQLNQGIAPSVTFGTLGDTGAAPKIDAGGTSQGGTGVAGNAGLGALTLNVNSTIDLTGTSVLHFANSTGQTWQSNMTLSITNWSGTPTTGGGAEELLFGTGGVVAGVSLTQLGQIQFIDPAGFAPGTYSAIYATGDLNEIVPGIAIAEPNTWMAAGLALAAIGITQRRRLRALVARRAASH